jgi:hypothetical protein
MIIINYLFSRIHMFGGCSKMIRCKAQKTNREVYIDIH